MNSAVVVVLAVLAAVNIQVASAGMEEVECKGKKYQVDEAHQAQMKECLAKVGVASFKDLGPQNAGCFSRCCMMQKGLIDDGGKPHKEKIMNMMDEHIPDEIRAEWKSAIEACLDAEGGKIDIADDQKCSSFLPLTMCVHTSFVKICKA